MAFWHVQGKNHSVNIASYFFKVLCELGILHKVKPTQLLACLGPNLHSKTGMIALNNAFNNDTMMCELQKQLHKVNIWFNSDGNHIW